MGWGGVGWDEEVMSDQDITDFAYYPEAANLVL